MTLCCQCSGVTPPPPPDPGACCSKVEGEVYTQCDDSVEYSDCMLKEMGIHHPNKTCAQLRIDNNYPTERTDWPEPACDLLGSCCFSFAPAINGDIDRGCQNAVPSGMCEEGAVHPGGQRGEFHYDTYHGVSCPGGGSFSENIYDGNCCKHSNNGNCHNCNCKVCTFGPAEGKDECWYLSRRRNLVMVKDPDIGLNDGLPIYNSGVSCSCNGLNPCCPPAEPPITCFIAGSQVLMGDGSYKAIESVEIGEEVQSLEGSTNTVIELERTILGNRKLVSINDSEFFLSDDHPLYTKGKLKSVNSQLTKDLYRHLEIDGDISIGDSLLTPAGEININDIEVREGDFDTPLYDLTLDGNNIYFVENIAVHNHSCPNMVCCHESGDYCFSTSSYCGYTCSALAAIKYPYWPSTGWSEVSDDCDNCPPTTTTTTEAPRGSCCAYPGDCQNTVPDTVECFDNQTNSDCSRMFELGPAGNQANTCVVSWSEDEICENVECEADVTTTTTTAGPVCDGNCQYQCQTLAYYPGGAGSAALGVNQWVLTNNNCSEGCCCPDIGNNGESDQCATVTAGFGPPETTTRNNCAEDCSGDNTTTTTTTTTAAPSNGACCWFSGPSMTANCSDTTYSLCGSLGDWPSANTWDGTKDCSEVVCGAPAGPMGGGDGDGDGDGDGGGGDGGGGGTTTTTTTTTTTAAPGGGCGNCAYTGSSWGGTMTEDSNDCTGDCSCPGAPSAYGESACQAALGTWTPVGSDGGICTIPCKDLSGDGSTEGVCCWCRSSMFLDLGDCYGKTTDSGDQHQDAAPTRYHAQSVGLYANETACRAALSETSRWVDAVQYPIQTFLSWQMGETDHAVCVSVHNPNNDRDQCPGCDGCDCEDSGSGGGGGTTSSSPPM